MRVPLDGQNWAEVKPVSELTRADRMAVNDVIIYEKGDDSLIVRASADDKAAGAVMARVITDWSFPIPAPSADPSSLDRLSLEQDDALRAAVEPHLIAIQGKNAPVKENEVPTPGSVSLSGTSRASPTTKKRSPGKWLPTQLTRKSWAGRRGKSTSSPSSKTTGLSRSSGR